MSKTLYYIHDPMCSWCWGFSSAWHAIWQALPATITVQYVVGGLAPDSDDIMPMEMQASIQQYWRRIEQTIPGIVFNYDFWHKCQPRRSTYPACRAVLAAKQQGAHHEKPMITAIQEAYYRHAQNPSDKAVLIALAKGIGLDSEWFAQQLSHADIQQQLLDDIAQYQQLSRDCGISGFPSLALQVEADFVKVPISYVDPQVSLNFLKRYY